MPRNLITNEELILYGPIGIAKMEDERGFTDEDVIASLAEMRGDIVVRLNSGGGAAFQGIAIHNALKAHAGKVTIQIDALAASAASVIAMAGDEIVFRDGALMMIHDPSGVTIGTADDHRKTADDLDKIADQAARIYANRSGQKIADVHAMMDAETWLDAEEAKRLGFASGEEDSVRMEFPRFPYEMFTHAPAAVAERAIAASAAVTKEGTMPNKTPANTAAEQPAATNAPQMSAGTPAAPVAPPQASVSAPAPTVTDGGNLTLDIMQRCRSANLSIEAATRIAETAKTLTTAQDMIIAELASGDPSPRDAEPRAQIRVIRDERDTLMAGLSGALAAQLSNSRPDAGPAVDFMGHSLAEMASASLGYRGSLRTAADREHVFRMAFAPHSTSDFPSIFENALNKALLERYEQAAPTYRSIARRRDFNDFRPHPMVRAGDFPRLQAIGEGGEIKFGTFGESKETAAVLSYAVQFAITRQMLINDDLGAIQDVLNDSGNEVAYHEEVTFYAMFGSATLADGKAVFHADHSNLAGSGALISIATLGAARAAMRKQKSINGKNLNIAPTILLVSPDHETLAQQMVSSVQPAANANVNPFSGKLEVVSSAELTGNPWFLLSDPGRLPNYVYGYLRGYEAPRVRMDEPFGVQGISVSLEHDFGVAAIDYRGAYKNPGAAPA